MEIQILHLLFRISFWINKTGYLDLKYFVYIKHNKFKLKLLKFKMNEQMNYANQGMTESGMQIKDLEEKQRIIKERLLLVGKSLIETKEKTNQTILEMKKDLEILKQEMERMKSFLETISGEFSKFARKEDLEILSKQAKMFQPLEFIKIKN